MADTLTRQNDPLRTENTPGTISVLIPHWLLRQGNEWIQLPEVESVVLFGSRVTGHASSVSDWDVAVLHRSSAKPSLRYSAEAQTHNVDLAYLSLHRFATESHLVGTLAHELANHSMVVAGTKPFVQSNESIAMSEDALERHLEHAFKELARAIREIVSSWEFSGFAHPIEEVVAGDASGSSANGAERVAKALCVYLGTSYAFTHDVEELAEIVPAEWRSKVLAMSSKTTSTHSDHYTGTVETIGDVVIRIRRTLDLLSEILVPCLEKLSDAKIAELTGQLRVSPDMQNFEGLLHGRSPHKEIQTFANRFASIINVLHSTARS